MARIKAECPKCGVVRLQVQDLIVRVCVDDDRGAYRFRCPQCSDAVVHGATPAICSLLASVGVHEELWRLPEEMNEHHTGPTITLDDVLDFHFLLERNDWAERLTAVGGDSPGCHS